MCSGGLFWSERQTGNSGVAVTEMASPGPWEEGHSPEPFFHQSSSLQVSREWQKVQVMPLTHSVVSGCICVMCFSAEKRKVHNKQQFLTLSRKMEIQPCFCVQFLTADPLCHRPWALLFLKPSDLLHLLWFWRKEFRAVLMEAEKPCHKI